VLTVARSALQLDGRYPRLGRRQARLGGPRPQAPGEAIFRPRYTLGSAVLIEGTDHLVMVAQTS
jgi:hypothetical protein